jgi:hypothetical protein
VHPVNAGAIVFCYIVAGYLLRKDGQDFSIRRDGRKTPAKWEFRPQATAPRSAAPFETPVSDL